MNEAAQKRRHRFAPAVERNVANTAQVHTRLACQEQDLHVILTADRASSRDDNRFGLLPATAPSRKAGPAMGHRP